MRVVAAAASRPWIFAANPKFAVAACAAPTGSPGRSGASRERATTPTAPSERRR
ncbi:hypothetical protein GLE_0158 [Lysobacter enzymogenes]|uniref:Uncharacterized protein n=1 Tax=Lysobacter enzymogenes TaxID=69 RepID=A0A0S2DAU0_LYSEN|nr:hypothetical protein GLE_0158 [Lysobacter enzymogenes]